MRGVPNHACRHCGKRRQKGDQFYESGMSFAELALATPEEVARVANNPMVCVNCIGIMDAKACPPPPWMRGATR